MSRALREIDGRWLTAMIIAGYFGLLAVCWYVFHTQFWGFAGVPVLPKPFHDLGDIATGIERFRTSDHPWSQESLIYSTGAYNYTKWWLCAAYLGLDSTTIYEFGVGLGSLFFLSALFVLGKLSLGEGGVAGLVLISPNVMTGIERANADLLIFVLMALALALRRYVPLATAVITLAAFLKIYPATALAALASRPWKKTLPWMFLAVALIAVDLLTSLNELRQIATNVTRVGWFSYGSTTMMERYMDAKGLSSPGAYKVIFIGSLMYLMVVGLSVWYAPLIKVRPAWERELSAFRIGAALFVGTFALGSNLDYRTIMLVFCLPLLFVLRKDQGPMAFWATLALCVVVFYLSWRFFLTDAIFFLFLLKQLISWVLLFLLVRIFVGTFDWHNKDGQRS